MTRATVPAHAEVRRPRGPLFAGLARAEWTKLRTLRSSYWTLLCAAYARHLTPR